MNLANKLTMIRIFLIPIFIIFITFPISNGVIIATAIFIIASLTDKLDGYIARKRNEITNFGKFMDPLADKLLVTAALLALVDFGLIRGWIVVVILAREFAVSGLRTIAASNGKVIAASMWGKVKTVIQMVATIAGLLVMSFESLSISIPYLRELTSILMMLAVIITIISGVDYFVKNSDVIDTKK
ncbi:CDP-diacylglycerol--glycerol-3-phosphate 3-phosphatidyltransferase [Clostridium collagenovorans DSM 3089]|uniref:CDP-diacylglycerol--glycerol-3-phosphate 3-phosphatidyltransferase n=1 Tax=Clostridium collagenovorans DSM 3089 TaxID=1121306 RepID=A0A1M5SXI8_9CLOT|nr:CDP-diacylglycerol--glycerol-3-phosphate 3-phosphatidyltransferase [Clostridium collagenovorans]SHH43186.1 CDP-diacylglycerol--glycerol-3-phosphate 3-phosphatidyltransferase [Clostridium collagenovorans DSM 3089]